MPLLTVGDVNDATQPSLVNVTAENATAALVYLSQEPGDPAGPLARITSLDAWNAWPPALTTPATILATAGGNVSSPSIIAGPAAPPADVAILFRTLAGVQTNAELVGIDGSAIEDQSETESGTPLFLTYSSKERGGLFGVSASNNGEFALDISIGQGQNSFEDACATTNIAADAVGDDHGWIVAAAIGTKLVSSDHEGSCQHDHPEATNATQLWLARAATNKDQNLTITDEQLIETEAPVTRVRVAPRSDGGWIGWSVDGTPTVSAGRLNDTPVIETQFQLGASAGTLVPELFGLSALGDGRSSRWSNAPQERRT